MTLTEYDGQDRIKDYINFERTVTFGGGGFGGDDDGSGGGCALMPPGGDFDDFDLMLPGVLGLVVIHLFCRCLRRTKLIRL